MLNRAAPLVPVADRAAARHRALGVAPRWVLGFQCNLAVALAQDLVHALFDEPVSARVELTSRQGSFG